MEKYQKQFDFFRQPMATTSFLILFGLVFCAKGEDPCQFGFEFKTLLRASYRGTSCSGKDPIRKTTDHALDAGWYKVQSRDGKPMEMVNIPPDLISCGSYSPIWMKGTSPLESDGNVNRTVCLRMSEKEKCGKSWNIKVRNCTSFIAYRLIGSDVLDSAYCFGGSSPCPQYDPCEEFYRQINLRDDGFRSETCLNTPPKCDDKIQSGWYRITDDSWTKSVFILQKPPKESTCGTTTPLWMNGTIPSVSDGEAIRTICASTTVGPCTRTFSIKVKNCSSFAVYYLLPPKSCPERYCFATKNKCKLPTTTTESVIYDLSDESSESKPPPLSRKETAVVVSIFVAILIGAVAVICTIRYKQKHACRIATPQMKESNIKTMPETQVVQFNCKKNNG